MLGDCCENTYLSRDPDVQFCILTQAAAEAWGDWINQSSLSLCISHILARFTLVVSITTHHIISMQQPMDDTPQHNKSQQTVPPSLTDCSRPMSRQQPPRHAPHTKTNAKHTPPTYTNTHTHTHTFDTSGSDNTQCITYQTLSSPTCRTIPYIIHNCLDRSYIYLSRDPDVQFCILTSSRSMG